MAEHPFTLSLQLLYPQNRPCHIRPCSHLLQTIIGFELANGFPGTFIGRNITPLPDIGSPVALNCLKCSGKCGNLRTMCIMLSRGDFDKNLATPVNHVVPKGISSVCVTPPRFAVHEIDSAGFRIVAAHLLRHMAIQEAMSWLSTLGGGFSNLGEKFEDAAEIAGEISLRQMHLAIAMKVPVFQARCRLFYAQSLMQRGRLKESAQIIRCVYYFSRTASINDNPPEVRLSLMCQGLWCRLTHLWSVRRQKQRLWLNLEPEQLKTMFSSNSMVEDNIGHDVHDRLHGSGDDELGNRKLFPDVAAILDVL